MNTYEQKQADRKARLEAASDAASERAGAAYAKADLSEEASGIPFGQPILVGHHSEGKHRAAIKRADNAMRRGIKESDRAQELAHRANAVGKGGISSDDPDAITKIKAKLVDMEAHQELMRAANKALRAAVRKAGQGTPDNPAWRAMVRGALVEPCEDLWPGRGQKLAETLTAEDWGSKLRGFEGFMLSNNSAKIKAAKTRIAQLEQAATHATKTTTFDGFEVVENVEQNRVQFLFDGKPDEATRDILKSRGFRWAPSQDAWQRQLTNAGIYAAKGAIASLEALHHAK